ncbi:MAG: hypothetical protein ABT940_10980 [Alphaproteobacteria bacterium]
MPSAPPASSESPSDLEKGELFLTYETGDYALLSMRFQNLSEMDGDDMQNLVHLLGRYNRTLFRGDTAVYMAAKTSAIMGAFENPNDALSCAFHYLNIMRGLNVEANVAINWGAATVRHDAVHSRDELLLHSIHPAARLEPVASSGEVVVLEEIRSHPETNAKLFNFKRVMRKWKREADPDSAGVDVVCYLVRTRQEVEA